MQSDGKGALLSDEPPPWTAAVDYPNAPDRDAAVVVAANRGAGMAMPMQTATKSQPPPTRRIFLVHGQDEGSRESVARFLERLGFDVTILHERANQGRTVIEKFEAHGNSGFAVVLLTPDDEGGEKGSSPMRSRARQNVLLEWGYFVGRLGRDHVCALRKGDVELPSDMIGLVWIPLDEHGGWKSKLASQ